MPYIATAALASAVIYRRDIDVMSILVPVALFYTMTDTLFWDLPGHVLAAPASALCAWTGVNSLCQPVWLDKVECSLSLSQSVCYGALD